MAPERWVRRFTVDEATLHPRGFTLYCITSYLFPRTSPESLTVVKVWKRYSDLQKLQRKMKHMHQALYLKGSCPNYSKWSYFKRFDSEVIEERLKTTRALLDFIAQFPPLFTSTEFVNFFKSSYPDPKVDPSSEPPGNIEAIRNALLLPVEPMAPIEYQSSEEDSFSIMDSPISSTDSPNIESSIQPTMVIKSDIQDEVDSNHNTTSQDVVAEIRSNLPDLLSFDRINMESSQISSDSNDSILNASDIVLVNNLISENLSSGDSITHTMDQSMISLNSENSSQHATLTRSSSRMDALSIDSAFSSSLDLHENYIFEAGFILRLGAKCESKREYGRAFDYYKNAIEKMLIGAQGDSNEHRREFIKSKIAKYLSHSEKLYSSYLNNPNLEMPEYSISLSNETTKTIEQSLRNFKINDLSRPYEQLGKYRVLKIIDDHVLLVLCAETQQCLIMKIIEKTCNQISDDDFFTYGYMDNRLPLLPINVPYMIRLILFVETPNLLFLVLQYASGGRLFDYINNHLKSVPQTPAREVNLENVFVSLEEIKSESEENLCDPVLTSDQRELIDHVMDAKTESNGVDDCDIATEETINDGDNLSVTDMVINSQRLLLNVDDALSGRFLNKSPSERDLLEEEQNKIDAMVSEVEEAFHGIQEKLKLIIGDKITKVIDDDKKIDLPPKIVCRWGAELLTAIGHLHRYGITCRTLNPNNLLLGDRGQLLLSYRIGFESRGYNLPLLNSTNGNRLQNLHVAPELQQFLVSDSEKPLNEKLCDFWSFGAILYELIVGKSLSAMHPTGIYSHTIFNFPKDIDSDAESLLSQLLVYNPHERLGCSPNGIDDIKNHPYFKGIDWMAVEDDFVGDK